MNRRIIFDVGHPAQVHQFKHIYWQLEKKGWECLFVAKDKDLTLSLLTSYGLNFLRLSENKSGLINKILQIPGDDFAFYKIVKSFKPDFILNRFSIHSCHISKLLGIVNFAFSDTEHASKLHKIVSPFVDVKFTGQSYFNKLGRNHIRYNSNIEWFYLHPDIFHPETNPFLLLNIVEDTPYCLVRFVSWNAHHDFGIKPMSVQKKIELVSFLSKRYKVFISSESDLPSELKKYKASIQPQYMHTVLQKASLYVGEGGSMASEAVCLRTPSVYINPLPLMGYLKEQEKFNLLKQITTLEEIKQLIDIGFEVHPNDYDSYFKGKINPVKFIIWFLEEYPDSLNILKKDPDFQLRFK
jgi:predicted glycosyltransferase